MKQNSLIHIGDDTDVRSAEVTVCSLFGERLQQHDPLLTSMSFI